ncbi:sulfurtransferase [Microbulbifer thermotolerans]|uniref:Rhodanese-like domain-containing protein n=1 Tax=Microbulbifer thermotolerans TaxID=252514 RepID=A0AB35HTI8_MICTH|nr:rhodanese-like domain-containing protein [Microbulbifer thermotolerans]MCX2795526.1 rhodanese-like domain-containing protein [Microbulbifer thermotolerans]MCX2800239.1 rhodanese-like domain-containing protein [Microbulbifer thermotolerans]MCX2831840.1 rhodanese-like domain-containing protein [Microbulbifer thermotolerans]
MNLIIEPQELADQLAKEDLLVVDLSSAQNYQSGHIPGALHLPFQALMAGTPPAPGKLPSAERLTQVFRAIGLRPGLQVVACDDEGGGWAGRFLWTLEVIGHKTYSYLNGGMHAWRAAGLPLSTEPVAPTASDIEISIDPAPTMDAEEIQRRLGEENFIIWDARSPEEYSGARALAMKAGHIPGAVNCEWTQLMDPQRDLRIRADARAFLAALGIDGNKQIVTHCQSHHRSGFTWLVGKSLGFDIRAYPGSWSEWGNLPDTPVES